MYIYTVYSPIDNQRGDFYISYCFKFSEVS